MKEKFEKQNVRSLKESAELLGISCEKLMDHLINRQISAGLIDGEVYFADDELKRFKQSSGTGEKTSARNNPGTGEKKRIIEVRNFTKR